MTFISEKEPTDEKVSFTKPAYLKSISIKTKMTTPILWNKIFLFFLSNKYAQKYVNNDRANTKMPVLKSTRKIKA